MTNESCQIELRPFAAEPLLALIESAERFAESFGLPAAAGLREFFVSDEVSPAWLDALRASSAPDPWTHGFAVIHQNEGLVIGTVGFKGPPDATGAAEIAYGIVPGFQLRGLATQAARAGIEFALGDERTRRLLAHTRPGPNASTRVLEKCGFNFAGEVVDPEDGPVWRWRRSVC